MRNCYLIKVAYTVTSGLCLTPYKVTLYIDAESQTNGQRIPALALKHTIRHWRILRGDSGGRPQKNLRWGTEVLSLSYIPKYFVHTIIKCTVFVSFVSRLNRKIRVPRLLDWLSVFWSPARWALSLFWQPATYSPFVLLFVFAMLCQIKFSLSLFCLFTIRQTSVGGLVKPFIATDVQQMYRSSGQLYLG